MRRFLARRLAFSVLLVIVVASSSLWLTRLAPGDLTAQLGMHATAEEIARARARYDLDRSAFEQWLVWLGRAARLEFGESFLYNRPVSSLVAHSAANTAVLAAVALAAATAIGLPLGMFTGSRTGAIAAMIRGASLVCLSVPPLLMSLVFVWTAARTGWFPVGGMSSIDAGRLS